MMILENALSQAKNLHTFSDSDMPDFKFPKGIEKKNCDNMRMPLICYNMTGGK